MNARDNAYLAGLVAPVKKTKGMDAEDVAWKKKCKANNISRVLENAEEFGLTAKQRRELEAARKRFWLEGQIF